MIWQTRRGAANNPSGWLTALLERKAPKLAAVALANKMARIAWKPMASATQAPAGLSQPPDEIGARGHCLNALAPTLQETERWTGSFDPQREINRAKQRPFEVAGLFGSSARGNHLGRQPRLHQQAAHMHASERTPEKSPPTLQARGRPHMLRHSPSVRTASFDALWLAMTSVVRRKCNML